MTLTTPVAETLPTTSSDVPEARVDETPRKPATRKATGKKAKTIELVLTVTGTADGEWRAELKQGNSYLARDLAVAAAAVSRAAKELHQDLATPIDAIIDEARVQQAAKVSALEAELEAARKALADLD
ncbi:DUF6319 family protein [Mycolicibacterium sp. P9-22]|uniref:DUF6319 family protein n=1 Tax=Mycolicibacterium sp. P9-22 TaxID=2024613 RepID=UPI001D1514FE|nr:DUF6319 family protein [Mycolicibacterium sp. P9-22]